jgi:hypothetical protein
MPLFCMFHSRKTVDELGVQIENTVFYAWVMTVLLPV